MTRHSSIITILIFLLFVFCVAENRSVRIAAVGDVMIGTSFPDSAALPSKPENLFMHVSDFLQDADLSVGNLEGCMIDSGGTPKDCWGKTNRCFIFRMPESYTVHLKNAGFDAFGLANNHVRDMGPQAYRRTMAVLNNAGLHQAGTYLAPTDTFTLNGIKWGFASFSPHWATARMYKDELVDSLVWQLDKQCDIVVVMFHAGGEGPKYRHVTRKRDIYKGTNRGNVYRFSHRAIDAGADVVLGSGPHVTRAVELYKDRFIAYSLGNFCTYKRFNLTGSRGVAPMIKIYTDSLGHFQKAKVIPIKQYYPGYPVPDKNKRALKELRELTEKDFPEMKKVLRFDDEGWILKR